LIELLTVELPTDTAVELIDTLLATVPTSRVVKTGADVFAYEDAGKPPRKLASFAVSVATFAGKPASVWRFARFACN
jgi:hypothetical protein